MRKSIRRAGSTRLAEAVRRSSVQLADRQHRPTSTEFMAITYKTPDDIAKLRISGRLAADVLAMIGEHVKAGVSTDELDALCNDYIVNTQKTIPANVGYLGFPKTVCTSVNQVVCHGIPNRSEILKDGDIINIDVAIIKDGYFGDTSRMYCVGQPSTDRHDLRSDACRHP
jgi:methionyl aminopeptidase